MHRLETDFVNAELARDILQLARRAFRAGRAFALMIGKQQLDGNLADLTDFLGLGADFQARLRRRRARALDAAPGDVHQAQTARAINAQVGMITKRRQVNVGLADQFEQVALAIDRHFAAVNVQCFYCGCCGGTHEYFDLIF